MNQIDSTNLPKHIAIIMDGNRRWAKEKGMPGKLGHTEGAKTLEIVAKYCNKIGIKYLTVYAFSTENWKRSKEEVDWLMDLLEKYIIDFDKNNKKENIKIRVIGDITRLRPSFQEGIKRIEENTKNNTGLQFNIALNYGGRDEIIHATKLLTEKVQSGEIKIQDIDEKTFETCLYTYDSPDVDLMIRTSGEIRVSNFLPWQLSYAEMYFTDGYWPDFKEKELDLAIKEYQKRNRKFGGK
jgi:undecaprenyl diphosphate synthase